MIKRICPMCYTPWYSSSTTDEIWKCGKYNADMPKEQQRDIEESDVKDKLYKCSSCGKMVPDSRTFHHKNGKDHICFDCY